MSDDKLDMNNLPFDAHEAAEMLNKHFEDISEPAPLIPSEALYGFAAWLTALKEPVTMGASHPAGIVAQLVDEFCKANQLMDPRPGFEKRFKYPITRTLHGKKK